MPPALPEAAFELALWELLKAMLSSRGDTMPTIRMMFFTQGTVKATLLEKRTDAATNPQLEIIVKSSCDKAVPIIKHIMATLVDVVDPNMNDLRGVIAGILQDRCAEAVLLCKRSSEMIQEQFNHFLGAFIDPASFVEQ